MPIFIIFSALAARNMCAKSSTLWEQKLTRTTLSYFKPLRRPAGKHTVGNKIIRELKIIFVKKLIANVEYGINICQVMIFRGGGN